MSMQRAARRSSHKGRQKGPEKRRGKEGEPGIEEPGEASAKTGWDTKEGHGRAKREQVQAQGKEASESPQPSPQPETTPPEGIRSNDTHTVE